jgi:hypothetical protein
MKLQENKAFETYKYCKDFRVKSCQELIKILLRSN